VMSGAPRVEHHGRLQRWLEDDAAGNLSRPHMPWASNEGIPPDVCALSVFIRSVLAALYAPDLLRRRLLTVKLRGRTTTSDRRGGPAISTGSRRAKQTTHHEPLQRLLDDHSLSVLGFQRRDFRSYPRRKQLHCKCSNALPSTIFRLWNVKLETEHLPLAPDMHVLPLQPVAASP
jgi:hypothetical protein